MALFPYADWTVDQLVRVIGPLGKLPGIQRLLEANPEVLPADAPRFKYGQVKLGTLEAFLNRVARGNYDGDIEVAIEAVVAGAMIKVVDAVSFYFDEVGFRRTPRGFKKHVRMADTTFDLTPPSEPIDYAARIAAATDAFEGNVDYPSASWFEDTVGALTRTIEGDPSISNALNGVHLPCVIPQMRLVDVGRLFDDVLMPALQRAFLAKFPEKSFNNRLQGRLLHNVYLTRESNLEMLVERVNVGPVASVDFPQATQGFSAWAQRQQMNGLPQGFVLDGFNAVFRAIMWIDVLARDAGNVPLFALSGHSYRFSERTLALHADSAEVRLEEVAYYREPFGYCSGGLSFIG